MVRYTKVEIRKDVSLQYHYYLAYSHWVQSKHHRLWFSTKTTFNVYVSQQSQIQFED